MVISLEADLATLTLPGPECPQGRASGPGETSWGDGSPGLFSPLPVLLEPVHPHPGAHGVLTPGAIACNAGLDVRGNGRKQPNGDREDEADGESWD